MSVCGHRIGKLTHPQTKTGPSINKNRSILRLFTSLLYCFSSYHVLVMGVVPSLMGNVCVCMYVVASPKRQGEAMNTGRQSPSSFRQVSWFILYANRTRDWRLIVPSGRTVDGSLVLSQVVEWMPHRISVKALIAKDVALRLMWCHWRAGLSISIYNRNWLNYNRFYSI